MSGGSLISEVRAWEDGGASDSQGKWCSGLLSSEHPSFWENLLSSEFWQSPAPPPRDKGARCSLLACSGSYRMNTYLRFAQSYPPSWYLTLSSWQTAEEVLAAAGVRLEAPFLWVSCCQWWWPWQVLHLQQMVPVVQPCLGFQPRNFPDPCELAGLHPIFPARLNDLYPNNFLH